MNDNRSKKFILVPFCLLAQAYQADGIVKYEWKSSIKPIVELLIDNDINIVQMPCSEADYGPILLRKPQGISKYNNEEFNKICEDNAEKVFKETTKILQSGYEIIAVLGIEQSPSCCVNYIYTNKGMEKRMGLYMEKLYNKIKKYNIPIIGINRKYINKSYNLLKDIIGENKI